jgi:hypothetical protein
MCFVDLQQGFSRRDMPEILMSLIDYSERGTWTEVGLPVDVAKRSVT